MNLYVCRCGHEVLSANQPEPIKWNDGHVCRLVLRKDPAADTMVAQMVSGFAEHCAEYGGSVDGGEFYDYVKNDWGHEVAQGPLLKVAWNQIKERSGAR